VCVSFADDILLNPHHSKRHTFRAQKKTGGKAALSDRPPSREGIHRARRDPQAQLAPDDPARVTRARSASIRAMRRLRGHRDALLHNGVSGGPDLHRHVNARGVPRSPARVVRSSITPQPHTPDISFSLHPHLAGSPRYALSAHYRRSTRTQSAWKSLARTSRTSRGRSGLFRK
jgi:hypothetical protein